MTREPSFLSKYAEWIYRGLTLVWLVVIFVAVLWLNSKFVTRSEFITVQNDVVEMKTILRIMAEQNKINDRQETALQDHEKRIRELEKK